MVALPSRVFRRFSWKPFMSEIMSEGKIFIDTITLPNSVSLAYGPEKPHFWHLYGRPNPLHFSQRQIVTSPHCGHEKWTAPSRGRIMRPHQLQEGILTVRISAIITTEAETLFDYYMPSFRQVPTGSSGGA